MQNLPSGTELLGLRDRTPGAVPRSISVALQPATSQTNKRTNYLQLTPKSNTPGALATIYATGIISEPGGGKERTYVNHKVRLC